MNSMKDVSQSKILIFNSYWPSESHPYITYLYSGLRDCYPFLKIFLFEFKSSQSAIDLIGEKQFQDLSKSVLKKFIFSSNPFSYLIPLVSILRSPLRAFKIFNICRSNGFRFHQALGQLIYYHRLIDQKFDLIYFNSLQIARHICIPAFFEKSKITCSSRGQDFDFEPDSFDKVLGNTDHLHVLGEYLKDKAIKRGFNLEKISIIRPAALPVNPSLLEFMNEDEHKIWKNRKEFNIISTSRLYWTKGYIYALRGIATARNKLKDISMRYIIVGDGSEMEFLKFETHRLGISDIVEFTGWKSQDEVNQLVQSADLYILLSIEEGFNNSVTQAQNLMKACIVSNAGGLPENVRDDFSGIVINKYSSEEFLNALTYILNSEILEKFSRNAIENVKDRSIDKQVKSFKEMFDHVLEN